MGSLKVDRESWNTFLVSTKYPWCWWCGRGLEHRPVMWPLNWIIERAHIGVQVPRCKDRRTSILLCSACHMDEHGNLPSEWRERLDMNYEMRVGHALWLKKTFDPEFYDRRFLDACMIGHIPAEEAVPEGQQNQLFGRRIIASL